MRGNGKRDNRRRSRSRSSDRESKSFEDSFGSRFRRESFSAPREMHKATCTECKNSCDVPFKPVDGRPVYCRDCFRKMKEQR